METITVKVKIRTDINKTKSVKVNLEFTKSESETLCFSTIVDKVYSINDPKLNEAFKCGYIIGVEQITF